MFRGRPLCNFFGGAEWWGLVNRGGGRLTRIPRIARNGTYGLPGLWGWTGRPKGGRMLQQGYLGASYGPVSCVVGPIAGASRRVFRCFFQVFYVCAGTIGRGPVPHRSAVQTRPGSSLGIVLAPPQLLGVISKIGLVPGGGRTVVLFDRSPPWLVCAFCGKEAKAEAWNGKRAVTMSKIHPNAVGAAFGAFGVKLCDDSYACKPHVSHHHHHHHHHHTDMYTHAKPHFYPTISAAGTFAQVQVHLHAAPCQMASLVGPDWLFWYPTWHRFGPRCPQNATPVAHTAALAPVQRLGILQDFRGGPVRLRAKGILMPVPFGCGAARCDPEMGRNTLGQLFFVCTPAPAAWHGRRRRPDVERGLMRVIVRG